jgi:DNA primase
MRSGRVQVHRVEDCIQLTRECRELAAKIPNPEYKRRLEEMADNWAEIAAERKLKKAQRPSRRQNEQRTARNRLKW